MCLCLRAEDLILLHADHDDYVQLERIHRLLGVNSGRKCHIFGLPTVRLNFQFLLGNILCAMQSGSCCLVSLELSIHINPQILVKFTKDMIP